ncbi:hypothetical protein [Streptomyces zingiberis]|uniref:Integral membrane protein n=1 Tax=Streptomyces zingiberis TaxID=2053010 RepID=A0ABX1C373_9ACTN|nr:hypothetical protein [Streptomyces zingiberis]NJQ03093.1 hypothetical protein [Streptomyces zingiberis]
MVPGRVTRSVRTAVFAAVCVLLAAEGHAAVSGLPVPGWALAAALCATAAGVWGLTGRERSPWLVTPAALAVQGVLHLLFARAQPAPGRPPGGLPYGAGAAVLHGAAEDRPHAHAGHAAHLAPADWTAHVVPSYAGGGPAGGGGGGIGMGPLFEQAGAGPVMAAVHLVIALVGAVWLSGGERALFRLLRAASARLAAPLDLVVRAVPLPRPPRRGPLPAVPCAPRPFPLLRVLPTRGPPPVPAVA